VLFDRFTGHVFTAGRTATDNLYLNQLVIVAGAPVEVKPVQIQLHDQKLSDGLAVLYDMQAEPGLQHIYATGDVVLLQGAEGTVTSLEPGYLQSQIPRVVHVTADHYRLQYLTAGELISLGDVQVARADLTIVATYLSLAGGPTATPLPVPTATSLPGEHQDKAP
jgi:hypothetical protein